MGLGQGMSRRDRPFAVLLRYSLRTPTSQGIIILEHFVKVFSTDRLFIFAEGLIEKSLWKGILLGVETLAEVELPGLILNGG